MLAKIICLKPPFLVPAEDAFELRWFTPTVEVDLCGHATLASAFVLSSENPYKGAQYRFLSKSGELNVRQDGDWFTLDLPIRSLEVPSNMDEVLDQIETAFTVRPVQMVKAASTFIAEFEHEQAVRSLIPDFTAIRQLDCNGLIVTAKGENCDFVSRFFAPNAGIDEDPVTGSAHCGLIPTTLPVITALSRPPVQTAT